MGMEEKLKEISKIRGGRAETLAKTRIRKLFDDNTFTEIDSLVNIKNEGSEVMIGYGAIEGNQVFAFSQDVSVSNGAMGKIHAQKIKKVYDLALKTGLPVIGIFDSKGAHIDEGFSALAAYGEILSLSCNLSGVVPQIAVILGTCVGTSALIAENSDIIIIKNGAKMYLNPVFDEKIGSAEMASANGTVSILAQDDDEAIMKARTLVSLLPSNNLSVAGLAETKMPELNADTLDALCEKYGKDDPSINIYDLLNSIFDSGSFIELYKDFGKSVLSGFARLNGCSCGVIACNRNENDGRLDAPSAVKIASLTRFFDAFNIPLITFVDTKGFETSADFETKGNLKNAAMVAQAFSEATMPQISVITGKAYGPAFITLAGKGANADMVLAWDSAEISVLNPETAVEILYDERITAGESREALAAEYKTTVSSLFLAVNGGYIDDVIEAASTRNHLISALDMLAGKRVTKLPKKHSNITL